MTGGGKHALIVANSRYDDALLRKLVAPSKDAQALSEVLADPDICGFHVEKLIDEASYRISEKIEAFFDERDRDDLALLYFSGHGITDDDGLLYYAASNTQRKRSRSTAVAASWVNETMSRCGSQRQVLILDCCHSGAFARTKSASTVNIGPQLAGRTPGEGRGRFVLTASDSFQYSFEGDAVEGQAVYSVFIHAVVEGLRSGEADLDNDGLITLDELYSYVHRRVRAETPQQSPRKWESDSEGTLVIGFNRRPVPSELPEDLQSAIDSYIPEARLKAVERLDKLLRGKHRGIAIAAQKTLQDLANDDSRRVSDAARQSLAAYAAELGLRPEREQGIGTKPAQASVAEPISSGVEQAIKDQSKTAASPDGMREKRQDVLAVDQGFQSQEPREVQETTGSGAPIAISPQEPISRSFKADDDSAEAPELFHTIGVTWTQPNRIRLLLVVTAVILVCILVFLSIRYVLPTQPLPTTQSEIQPRNPAGSAQGDDGSQVHQNALPEKGKKSNPTEGAKHNVPSKIVAADTAGDESDAAQKVPATLPKRVNISAGVASGMLIQRTEPAYPPIAKAARVSGTVVLQALISKSGSIESLRVVSGPAMLEQSALDAVKTWRYGPYLLHGEAVEVETTVNVIFTLGG